MVAALEGEVKVDVVGNRVVHEKLDAEGLLAAGIGVAEPNFRVARQIRQADGDKPIGSRIKWAGAEDRITDDDGEAGHGLAILIVGPTIQMKRAVNRRGRQGGLRRTDGRIRGRRSQQERQETKAKHWRIIGSSHCPGELVQGWSMRSRLVAVVRLYGIRWRTQTSG